MAIRNPARRGHTHTDLTTLDQLLSMTIVDASGADSVNLAHGGTDLTVTGVNTADVEFVGFTGALDLRDGMDIRVRDSDDDSWWSSGHDGTDSWMAHTGTTDYRITGMTRDVVIGDSLAPFTLTSGPYTGLADHAVRLSSNVNNESVEFALGVDDSSNNRRIRLYLDDATGVWGLQGSASSGTPTFGLYQGNTLMMSATSTVVTFPGNTTSFTGATVNLSPTGNVNVNPTGTFQVLSANTLKVYDSANDDSIGLSHDGSWGRVSIPNTVGGKGLRLSPNAVDNRSGMELIQLAAGDDTTASVTLPHGGGMYFIIGSTTSIAQANDMMIGVWQSTTINEAVYQRAASVWSLGTGSNPDVDVDTNIWFTSSGTVMNIKNRRGSFRYYNIIIMGGDS